MCNVTKFNVDLNEMSASIKKIKDKYIETVSFDLTAFGDFNSIYGMGMNDSINSPYKASKEIINLLKKDDEIIYNLKSLQNIADYIASVDSNGCSIVKNVTPLPPTSEDSSAVASNSVNVNTVGENPNGDVADSNVNSNSTSINAIDSNSGNSSDNGTINGESYTLTSPIAVKVGNEEITINPGTYKILDKIVDPNGNVKAVLVISNGYKIWLYLDENGNVISSQVVTVGEYNVNQEFEVTVNNNKVTVKEGNYKVINTLYNEDGTVKAICVVVGGYKMWLYLDENGDVVSTENITENSYTLKDNVSLIIDGQNVNITPGSYEVVDVIYNEDGSINAVFIKDKDYEVILYLDENGNIIKKEVVIIKNGIINIKGMIDVYDSHGNFVSSIKDGKFYIYKIKYDSEGNIIAFRISKDGEQEQWIMYNESTKDLLNYNLVETKISNDNSLLELFGNDKAMMGILGILTIALGTTLLIKKKSKKNKDNNEDTNFEESSIGSGNYAVYDVKKDDDNNITDVRISPDGEDEYWVEM